MYNVVSTTINFVCLRLGCFVGVLVRFVYGNGKIRLLEMFVASRSNSIFAAALKEYFDVKGVA